MRISARLLAAALSSVALASPSPVQGEASEQETSLPGKAKRQTLEPSPPNCALAEASWPLMDTADVWTMWDKYRTDLYDTELTIAALTNLSDVRGTAMLCVYNQFNTRELRFTGLTVWTALKPVLEQCCGDPGTIYEW